MENEPGAIEHREFPIDEKGEVKVHVFGTADSFQGSTFDLVLNQTFKRLHGFASASAAGGASTEGGSSQVSRDAANAGLSATKKMQVEQPLVDPTMYREVYRRDPQQRACVDVKAAYVAGQGWRMRPRNELFGNDQFSVAGTFNQEPDQDQLARALAFLNASEPEYSLIEMLMRVETDVEAEGNGYIEVCRNAAGEPTRLCYTSAETMRILSDYSGFVQVRGKSKAFWSRYGTRTPSVVVTKSDDTGDGLGGLDVQFVGKVVSDLDNEAVEPWEVSDWVEKAETGNTAATSVNEMMHIRVYTPRDTNYGEPCIISAIEDYLGANNARMFMISYFDRCTVPRLAVIVKGDLSESVLEQLKKWSESQDKMEAMNSTLVLELPDGTDATFERLSLEHLKDGGLLEYREACNAAIRMAHRTPESMTGGLGNSNRAESGEANVQFIRGVIRPLQMPYMSRINYLLRTELGITDWVFDLNVPDLDSEMTKAQIADIYMRRGALSINDVHKSQGRAPVVGGEEGTMTVPGAGIIPVSKIAEVSDRMATAQGQKTFPKGGETGIKTAA
ncbi:MAG: phage portal protein [Armatimonadota bacterium]